MGWVFRQPDIHRCALPVYDKGKIGDIWQCDVVSCGKKWKVYKINYDQRDGDCLVFHEMASEEDIRRERGTNG